MRGRREGGGWRGYAAPRAAVRRARLREREGGRTSGSLIARSSIEAFRVAATPPERAKTRGEPPPPPKDAAKAPASLAARARVAAVELLLPLATEAAGPKRTSVLPDEPSLQPSADAT